MALPRQLLQVQDCCRFRTLKGAESLYLFIILCITLFHTVMLTLLFQENLAKEGAVTLTRMSTTHRKMHSLHS